MTPAVEGDLAAHARPDCPRCGGSGVEKVEKDDAPSVSWSNENAAILFRVLGVDPHVDGLSLAEARRAAMWARARRDFSEFARRDEVLHGHPRDLGDGVTELRPARGWCRGLDAGDIRERVEAFAEFVEEVAEGRDEALVGVIARRGR